MPENQVVITCGWYEIRIVPLFGLALNGCECTASRLGFLYPRQLVDTVFEVLGSTYVLIQCVLGCLSVRIKRPELEVNHLHSSNTNFKIRTFISASLTCL